MIKINNEFFQRISKIEKELERYDIIINYYNENPQRITDYNKRFLLMITERLEEVSKLKIPSELKIKSLIQKLNFFWLNFPYASE
jgi:hypothetical protein